MKILGINISKTTLLGWFMTISGFTAIVGLDFDIQAIGHAFVTAWDSSVALYGLIVGPILIWLRSVTSVPLIGGLISNLLGKKE